MGILNDIDSQYADGKAEVVVDGDATTTEKNISGSAASEVKHLGCSYDLEMPVYYSGHDQIVF